MKLSLSPDEAREVREALLETRVGWSPVLDRVTKELLAELDRLAVVGRRYGG